MSFIKRVICKIFGHSDRDDFDMDRKPHMLMWRCIRCGRKEPMVFTCFMVRKITQREQGGD